MDFAADLQKFTKEKLTHLRYVKSHLAAQLILEMDGARTAEAVEPKETLEPREDKLFGRLGTDTNEPAPGQENLPEKFVFEMEFNSTLGRYLKTYATRYDEAAAQLTGANANDRWDRDRAIAAEMQSGDEMKLDQLGKKYMAGLVIKELLAMEQAQRQEWPHEPYGR